MDFAFRDTDAELVVAYESASTGHAGESAFNNQPPGQDIKVWVTGETPHNLDNKVEEDDFVHELGAVIGAIDEEMPCKIFLQSNLSDSALFPSPLRPYGPASLASTASAWITKPSQRESFFQTIFCLLRHGSTIRCPDATLIA
jgi:hypothetical protein